MRDDDRTVSAREWRAVREGETHAAARTSTNNTPESFLVGIGASGALLAGAAILFVTLVGLVSFNVWPTGHEVSVDGNVELSAALPASPANTGTTPVSAAAGQLASSSVPGTSSGGNGGGGTTGAGDNRTQRGDGGKPGGGLQQPPAATPPPSTTDTGGSNDAGGNTRAPGTATKSPSRPEVHLTHPDAPHRNVTDGTNGKEVPGTDGGDTGVVEGKGPLGRPSHATGPDSGSGASTSSTGTGRGHQSSGSQH